MRTLRTPEDVASEIEIYRMMAARNLEEMVKKYERLAELYLELHEIAAKDMHPYWVLSSLSANSLDCSCEAERCKEKIRRSSDAQMLMW